MHFKSIQLAPSAGLHAVLGLVLAHVALVQVAHLGSGSVHAARVGVGAGVRARVGSRVASSQPDDGRVAVEPAVVVVPGHVDVAAATPAASPGVLDGDLGTVVSDHGDCVVGTSTASGIPENSTPVLLALVSDLEGNGDGSSGEGAQVTTLTS